MKYLTLVAATTFTVAISDVIIPNPDLVFSFERPDFLTTPATANNVAIPQLSFSLDSSSMCTLNYKSLPFLAACTIGVNTVIRQGDIIFANRTVTAYASALIEAADMGSGLEGGLTFAYGVRTPELSATTLPLILGPVQTGARLISPNADFSVPARVFPESGTYSLKMPTLDIEHGVCISTVKNITSKYFPTQAGLNTAAGIVESVAKVSGTDVCAKVYGLQKYADDQQASLQLIIEYDFLDVAKMDFSVVTGAPLNPGLDAQIRTKIAQVYQQIGLPGNRAGVINIGQEIYKFIQSKSTALKGGRRLLVDAPPVDENGNFMFGGSVNVNSATSSSVSFSLLFLGLLYSLCVLL